MRSFDEIYAITAERKGGVEALEEMLTPPPDRAGGLTNTHRQHPADLGQRAPGLCAPGIERLLHYRQRLF